MGVPGGETVDEEISRADRQGRDREGTDHLDCDDVKIEGVYVTGLFLMNWECCDASVYAAELTSSWNQRYH